MKALLNSRSLVGTLAVAAMAFGLAAGLATAAQKAKLPKPRVLEHEVELSRDPSTGDLRANPSRGPESPAEDNGAIIRSRVALVEVQCTVTAPDGVQVRGLTQDDFRVLEDGAEQKVASFD